ncbi:MAG: hypothetical protein ACYTG6_00725 [Planctomycetota bacterium]|jgi:anti-sigma28 factor (negative regulator of flagellin synthesis)
MMKHVMHASNAKGRATSRHDDGPAVRAPGADRLTGRAQRAAEGDELRPIGPKRLKALREAIRKGTYPRDADVAGGLARMFGKPQAKGRKKRS